MKIFKLLTLFIAAFLLSCSKDSTDDNEDNTPQPGTTKEFIVDITHVRDGSSKQIVNAGGATTCMFVDGILFDKDPYAKSYTVLFYDMSRTLTGQATTYPANATFLFNANAGNEIVNGVVGPYTYHNWYGADFGAVTKITPQNKLFVMAGWCTTGSCVDNCYWINGKAKVTVHY